MGGRVPRIGELDGPPRHSLRHTPVDLIFALHHSAAVHNDSAYTTTRDLNDKPATCFLRHKTLSESDVMVAVDLYVLTAEGQQIKDNLTYGQCDIAYH